MERVTETAAPEGGQSRGPGSPDGWRDLGRRMRLLRRVPLLRGLSWDLLGRLATVLRLVEVGPGEVLYRQGDPAVAFYVIESGRLSGTVAGSEEVWSFQEGQSVGDAALVGEDSFRATLRVEERASLWTVSAATLADLKREHPPLEVALEAARGAESGPERVEEEVPGFRIDVVGLHRRVKGGKLVLHDVSFSVQPGEMVAILGGSGAGKTTLLEAMAAVAPAEQGKVLFDGVDAYANIDAFRSSLGYVPQDDIIHKDLPLALTLRYAARLRLPAGTSPEEIDRAVADAMDALDLTERADLRVGSLSGGQRKRASIGVELLTRPKVFFLDEPTSGLDPATEAEMMRLLRRLADAGSTVVLTTHVTDNIGVCDRVVFLARDGHLAFFGTPAEAEEYFLVDSFGEMYERVAQDGTPEEWGRRFRESRDAVAAADGAGGAPPGRASPPASRRTIGAVRQWLLLTRRNVDILVRSRLTVAILVGSPVLVVLMFVVLFRPNAFDPANPSPSATLMILFWVAFGGFFFGLTYGLLQIVTEFPILRRERLVGLGIGPYVASKLMVLLPILAVVDVAMLGVLRVFHRLPGAGWGTYASLGVTFLLDSVAALALGLATSAGVADASQATLALPMICFPEVLFSGAILPVPIMATLGRIMSFGMSDRWAFEAMGRALNLNALYANGGSPLGAPLLAQYGSTFSRAVWADWAILGAFTVAFLGVGYAVLARKVRAAGR